MEQGETLEKFLDRVVRPDTEFIRNCGDVIDTVVRLIHKLRQIYISYMNKTVFKMVMVFVSTTNILLLLV
jgi:hypothetical protein